MPIIFDYNKGKKYFSLRKKSSKNLVDVTIKRYRNECSHKNLNNIFTENLKIDQSKIHESIPEIVRDSYVSNDNKIYMIKDGTGSINELYERTKNLSLDELINEVRSGNKFISDGKGFVKFHDFKSEELLETYNLSGGDNQSWLELDNKGSLKIHTYALNNSVDNLRDKMTGKPHYTIKIK